MHFQVKSMSYGIVLCVLAISPVITSGTANGGVKTTVRVTGSLNNAAARVIATASAITKSAADAIVAEAKSLYDTMDLQKFGLSGKAFEYAWKGYKYLVESGKVKTEVLSICDFS